MKRFLLLPLGLLTATAAFSQPLKSPNDAARRVEVLFLGAPAANHPAHDPVERYRILRKHLGTAGINFTYTEDLADLNRAVLDHYDAVMMYGNWMQNGPMDPAQETALIGYVENGGGFLPIHCASACFGKSDAFVKLVGGRFESHGTDTFTTRITAPNHPVMRGYEGFETWDETYVHDRHGDDRTILQVRDQEPWTWVREQGKGRVFYTAYGHDMRCWSQPAFHKLLRRGVLWSVGAEVRSKLRALKLPTLKTEEMLLPGYREHKAITRGQSPLPPMESMKLAQVANGFELSLFASEPEIVNPIHVAWDHRGRAFVVETIDYPNNLQAGNLGNDRIKICEDTDGDGRADKFTLFAAKLSIPTSLTFANGGVICTNGSQMLFLKDTNGDDKADERKVLFEGFNTGDTHAGVSNLRYGFDNWIYATIGYAGFKGTVGGEEHKFSTGVFRFKPDGSKLEFLQNTTNNTWGLGFTSDFDIMGSTANGNPSWFYTFPKTTYQAAGMKAPRTPRADDNPLFFPISTDIRQVDVFDRYTSAAGHAFYTSDRFPESYRDRVAFICGPTGKLVGQFDFTATGAGFTGRQLPNNLYSSADAWSAPVCAEVGPDGAMWVCDWYNIIVQHNPTPNKASAGMDAKRGRGNAYVTPLRDKQHGRIYRIYPKDAADGTNPQLDPTDPDTLIAALADPNLFWRLQAQRLLVETRATSAIPKLRDMIKPGTTEASAFHAFCVLQGLGALDGSIVKTALESGHRGLRKAAIEDPLSDGLLIATYTKDGILTAADNREFADVFIALRRLNPSDGTGSLLFATLNANLPGISNDPILSDAWQIAAHHHANGVLLAAATTPSADEFAKKLISGLKATKVDAEPITRKHTPDPAVHARGLQTYTQTCIACHGPEGKGVPLAFPPLDGSSRLTGTPAISTRIVLHGLEGPLEVESGKFNNIMAPLGNLTDTQIADVLTFTRQSWSNDAAPVTAESVKNVRAKHNDRSTPWKAEDVN